MCLEPGLTLWYDSSNGKDMTFGAWTVMNPYMTGSFITVTRELARYKLALVSVQEVRWDKGGTVRAGDYIAFCGQGNENHHLATGFSYTIEYYPHLRE